MATISDIATVVRSALAEIGVTGQLDVRGDRMRITSWVGAPTDDDVEVTVTVKPLERD